MLQTISKRHWNNYYKQSILRQKEIDLFIANGVFCVVTSTSWKTRNIMNTHNYWIVWLFVALFSNLCQFTVLFDASEITLVIVGCHLVTMCRELWAWVWNKTRDFVIKRIPLTMFVAVCHKYSFSFQHTLRTDHRITPNHTSVIPYSYSVQLPT